MYRIACWISAAALAMGLSALTAATRPDDEPDPKVIKAAVEAVTDYMKGMDKKKADDLKKDAEALSKKHKLEMAMYVFKPRVVGGLGLGTRPGAIKPDGIELKFDDLIKTKLKLAELKAQGPALVRAAEVTSAMADLVQVYPLPPGKKAPAGAWAGYSKDMKKGAEEVMKAAKGTDPAALQKAVGNLVAACNECHKIFRD